MANWSLYETRLKINGITTRDRQINLMKDAIENDFQNSPSFRQIYFNDDITTTGVQIIDDKDDYNIKKVLMQPGDTIAVGHTLNFDNTNWLCTNVDKTNPVYEYGIIQKATHTLTLYKNHILSQIPIVIESGIRLFQLGTSENKYIETPSTIVTARISSTSITRQLTRGEIYQIGVSNWKINDINDILEPGLLILKLEYSEQAQDAHNFALTILNGSNLQINTTQSLTINAELTDNGEIVTTPLLSFSSSDEEIATISSSGVVTILTTGTVVFTVSMTSNPTLNDTISVVIIAEDQHNYTYGLMGSDEIIKGYSKEFTASKFDNGIAVVGALFDFEVISGTTPTNAYTLIIVDGDTCSILANMAIYNITLRAMDRADHNKYIDKIIKLNNLF